MDYQAENLILHFVTEYDLAEVARTWPSGHHPLAVFRRLWYIVQRRDCLSRRQILTEVNVCTILAIWFWV